MPSRKDQIEALDKARAWCARQERCQEEVRNKLYALALNTDEVEATIARLIAEGFLNEARFAAHYAVSKARQKGWGPRKIEHALRARQVSEPCIRLGLNALDGQEQDERLTIDVAKRWERRKAADDRVERAKLLRYFLGKGFSADAVKQAMGRAGIATP